jgi:starch synthase
MLIPSLFEPCGLVQLIAMKYGSLPVARKTGGLKDTIEHHQTGFLFERYATSDMLQAVTAAIRFIEDEDQHLTMITRAMNQSFTWKQAAIQYRRLYHRLVNGKITSVDF